MATGNRVEPVVAKPCVRVGEDLLKAMQQLRSIIVEIDVEPWPRGIAKVRNVIRVSGFEPFSHGLLETGQVQCCDTRFIAASARTRAVASSSSKSQIGGILWSRSTITATAPARVIAVSKRSQTSSHTD